MDSANAAACLFVGLLLRDLLAGLLSLRLLSHGLDLGEFNLRPPLGVVPPVSLLAKFLRVGILPTTNASASGTRLQFTITQRARASTGDS
jgi:hypothetical protein